MNRFAQFFGVLATVLSFAASAASSSFQGVNYSVVSDKSKRDIKRAVEVVLDERLDQPTLEALANQIKNSNPMSFQRTFISWRIKGEDGGGYWAKTDFDPTLTVRFLGTTVAEYNKLKASSTATEGEVFGSWLSNWGTDYKMVGYRKSGKIFIRSTFKDGSSGAREFVSKKISGRSVLIDAEGSDFGEYFLVNEQGDLEFWGENGAFYTAKKTN
ncbi:hypothetical protein C5612_00855 [Pseudomonas frederiksbergensis]|uniref:Uncharacterized protein n=1 Tax=Pseudomonas frederiksbergensis TaxID=104087 RepID=A0A2S8HUV7_9PSED|nr:hypothetical protein [Pseudomonas frederiksbergensis]PQP06347.1 hypothetical protein C5612_00855 [Pseudomonas frederiksbergensis]